MPERPANSAEPPASTTGLALRFISGKYQGGEFPLKDGREIIVGRSSELDMVLVEEMVSRKHARIQMKAGSIMIEDLGSTNGTFVNGEKIKSAKLKLGDRVLIGTSILKVVNVGSRAVKSMATTVAGSVPRPSSRRSNQGPGEAPRMTGNLEEIPLPDLLQLFGTSRKTGVLVLKTEGDVGKIYLDGGTVMLAEIQSKTELLPLKAIYRMLGWNQGFFELDPPEDRKVDAPMNATVQEVLMEGFRQQDELQQLLSKLPALESRLTLRTPLEAPLHELDPQDLEVLQTALNSPSFAVLMDRSSVTDLKTAQIVESLVKRGYLMAAQ